MNIEMLDHQIEGAYRRLHELSRQAGGTPEQQAVMSEALEQLSIALHELQVTSEELREQNDELAATRAAVEAERQRYQELFDFAPDGYVVTDADGVVQEANRVTASQLRVRQESLVGKPLSVFVPASERVAFLSLVNRLRQGGGVGPVEIRLKPRRANPFPARLLVAPATDRDGRLVGLRWSIQDVSKLKRAEQQALQSARLAAVGEAMIGLTHESRNALQRSQSCLELLANRIHDRPEALQFITRIQEAQDYLHRLFEEVRNYAAPMILDIERCDLGAVLDETWHYLTALKARPDARLAQQFDQLNLWCEVDANRIRQVFRNILENSFTACQGPVEISARWSEQQIAPQLVLQVAICDNGPGLSAVAREKIFAPFYTTKTQGTGLGMAIARRIVEAHGGHIAIGNPTTGAEIVVALPRVQALAGG